jgi:hypothetical protein
MTASTWQRVTKAKPCPVCNKPDWCLIARDGSAAICARVESVTRCGESGYLHRLGPSDFKPDRVRRVALPAPKPVAAIDFYKLAERYHAAVNPFALVRFASELGVDRGALWRLGVGWDGAAWTFPMTSAGGRVCGIRRRLPDGRKLSVRGGQEGLFVPEGLPASGSLLATEGPTDCAALLTLGFTAIGRPSCRGGVKLVCALGRGRPVVIVADADAPGQLGAEALAAVLCLDCPTVRIIRPPAGVKDARQWVQRGATAADVQAAIDAAEPMRLRIKTRAAAR